MSETTAPRYSAPAMLFHWAIAIAVITQWRIAEAAEEAEHTAGREAHNAIMASHFSLGVVIAILVVIRLAIRITGNPPALASSHASWERILARTTHTVFYVLLLVMPLAGWLAMSKYGSPVSVFGVFELPPLPVAPDPEGGKAIFESHAVAGTVLLVLVAVHVLGTLKHTLIDKDGNLFRMLPFGQPKA